MDKVRFDVADGTYDKSQILTLIPPVSGAEIFYSLDGTAPTKKYYGPVAVRFSSTVKAFAVAGNEKSEISELNLTIQKPGLPKKGSVVIIGGAEHCKEIHQKLVALAGGPENVKIGFLPTSSADPYIAGIDRQTRFRELAGVVIDEKLVPHNGVHYDYSHTDNKSRFWIIPVALKDDEFTAANPEDDEDPLAHIETFPDIDESTWSQNAYHKDIAEKLRDEGFNLIFMTGGNQARYLKCLYYPDWTESPVLSMMREILEEKGGVITGTSAGAAVLSEVMIQGGGSYGATMQGVVQEDIDLVKFNDEYTPFKDLYDGRVWIGKGFGFLPKGIISGTHFVQRGRTGRLLTAALHLKDSYGQNVVGIGVGEDAAVVVYPDQTCEVVGATGVLVLDPGKSHYMKGSASHGEFWVEDMALHYFEHGDIFALDPQNGQVVVKSINPAKKLISEPEHKSGENYYYEPDIFGKNTIKKFVYDNLINNEANDCIGLEIIDNTENSYDSTLFHDMVKDDTMVMYFKKGPETKGFMGELTYQWWGSHDDNYPNLITEREDRFSYSNVLFDLVPMDVLNYPDMSDAEDIPLLGDYLDDGKTVEEWQEMFDDYKRFYFGIMVIPVDATKMEVRTFFFDYAYNDLDHNGHYSPPRLMQIDKGGDHKDYDIVEMNIAPNAEVFIDNEKIGLTDAFGCLMIEGIQKTANITVKYSGKRNEYTAETGQIAIPVTESFLSFSERSY